MSKGWDSIALKKLKSLTGKGLSTSEIGKRLGMSKNAIVGKLNRLGWNAKAGGAPTDEAETKADKPASKSETKKTTAKKVAEPKKVATPKSEKTTKATKTETKKAAETQKKTATAEPKTTETTKSTGISAKNLAMHQRIIQHSLEMANLKPNQCRWPIGDPDSEHFHFCGETAFVGKPYCYEHCKQAYQFAPPKKK